MVQGRSAWFVRLALDGGLFSNKKGAAFFTVTPFVLIGSGARVWLPPAVYVSLTGSRPLLET